MRPPRDYGWNPIENAPLDENIALQVTDGRGAPYALQWPCRRTATGGSIRGREHRWRSRQ
jgi:hypothetical protein